jgi:hypothetical protein
MLQLKLFYKILNKGELEFFIFSGKSVISTLQLPLKEKLKIL